MLGGACGHRSGSRTPRVETFRPRGAHEPLRDTVGLRGAKRRANDLDPATPKHLVKSVGEFLVSIANQEPNGYRAVHQSPGQLACALHDPRRTEIRGASGQAQPTAAQLNEEERVEPLQPDRLHGEEIDGEQALPMRSDEFAPGHPASCAPGPRPAGEQAEPSPMPRDTVSDFTILSAVRHCPRLVTARPRAPGRCATAEAGANAIAQAHRVDAEGYSSLAVTAMVSTRTRFLIWTRATSALNLMLRQGVLSDRKFWPPVLFVVEYRLIKNVSEPRPYLRTFRASLLKGLLPRSWALREKCL
jgi:hypothetical protein